MSLGDCKRQRAMFKDKVFNISFLISFCWHLFFIFAVVLVITPKGFTINKFPTIDFLGPILEKDIFRPDYGSKQVFMPTPYKEDFTFDKEVFLQSSNYLDIAVLVDKSLLQPQFAEPAMEKQIPAFIQEGVPAPKKADTVKAGGGFPSWSVLYKPPKRFFGS